MKKYLSISLFCLWAFAIMAAPVQQPHVQAELVSAVESIQPGSPFWVALRLKMEPHWHVYWRNAGDAGLATRVEWDLPEGFDAGPIQWPYPEFIATPPLANFGYEDEVFLLTEMTPPARLPETENIIIRGTATWLVCKEICIPGKADVSISLSTTNGLRRASTWVKQFEETRKKLPLRKSAWTFTGTLTKDHILLRASMSKPHDVSAVRFFPYEGGIIQHSVDQVWAQTDSGFTLNLLRSRVAEENPTHLSGILVADSGWKAPGSAKALEINVPVSVPTEGAALMPATPAGNARAHFSLIKMVTALLAAFAGGIILNLMPCVFPIISMKVLGFVKQAHGDDSQAWKHGLIFTFGVLVSFWVLAGVLIALRATGEQLGWGFQLQSPVTLIALSLLFFMLALNLFGVFEVGLSLTGVGSTLTGGADWRGSFFSGLLATVVATPCTAPFMGVALGYALTQPVWVSMLVFTSLGLGMSSPYLLLSRYTALMKRIPPPGPWMESFKQAMGFLLMATILWLVWVLEALSGAQAIIALLSAFLLMWLGGWILGRWGSLSRAAGTRRTAWVMAILLVVAGAFHAFSRAEMNPSTPAHSVQGEEEHWQPFSPEKVAALRAAGKPVFIDFTAKWCLSCQVNKKAVLTRPEVETAFMESGVITLRADWTRQDETITKALAEFGRSSVPLYVLYGKSPGSEPVILPELLTPQIVLEALAKIR